MLWCFIVLFGFVSFALFTILMGFPVSEHWMKYGPETDLQPSPQTITVEITTRCNLTCVMCPHGMEGAMLAKRDAPAALVDSVISNLNNVSEIHPTGVGEPLMSEGFWRIVDQLKNAEKPALAFHTNGILLTKRNIERLAEAPISRVNVSVDAASDMTYRRVRGANMDKTLEGIKRLVKALTEKSGQNIPPISMSMVLMRETVEEASDFVQLAHSLGVRFVYFEHLTEPFLDAKEWTVNRGNFRFNYDEQRLFDSPEFSDAHMLKALDLADEIGVVVEGYEVILGDDGPLQDQRPCRNGSLLQHYQKVVPGMSVEMVG